MSDLSIIVRKMRTHAEHSMSGYGLGFPEQLVLMFLNAHGASSQERIASELDIDKGAIAKTVAKLDAKGLVRRSNGMEDRRVKIVSFTDAALPVVKAMEDSFSQLSSTLFKGLSPEEIQAVSQLVARIASNI